MQKKYARTKSFRNDLGKEALFWTQFKIGLILVIRAFTCCKRSSCNGYRHQKQEYIKIDYIVIDKFNAEYILDIGMFLESKFGENTEYKETFSAFCLFK